ncbi:MAG: leucine-rich repeat domain-containing protein [bacterium]
MKKNLKLNKYINILLFATIYTTICVGDVNVCSINPLAPLEVMAYQKTTGEWISIFGIEGGAIKFDSSTGTITDANNKITTANIPNTINGVEVKSIGEWAFADCDILKSITIPNNVTSIGDIAFANCTSLEHISIPNSVKSIGSLAFNRCENLESIVIPDSVKFIGNFAFGSCTSLKSVVIPNSFSTIADGVFHSCTSLESIAIPSSIIDIGDSAFFNCTSLKDVYYTSIVGRWNDINIQTCNDDLLNATIHYKSSMPKITTITSQSITSTKSPYFTPEKIFVPLRAISKALSL